MRAMSSLLSMWTARMWHRNRAERCAPATQSPPPAKHFWGHESIAAGTGVDGLGAPVFCSRCGTPSQPGGRFCGKCGSPLVVPAAAPVTPPSIPYLAYPTYPGGTPFPAQEPFVHGPPPREAARQAQIRRTQMGVLFLVVGALVYWIPVIGVVGLL